jgi:excisionase family DNA binding protein
MMDEVRNGVSISEKLCLSIPEAAALLGISRNLAYEMAKQGQLPVVRFGRRLLVPKVALESMLKECSPTCLRQPKGEVGPSRQRQEKGCG